ncbi:MAG: Uma2 family endonuclease [Methylococcales bacterium]
MALQPQIEFDGIAMTEDEYLSCERSADISYEYLDGHAYAMTGSKKNHNLLTMNIARKFGNHLQNSPCATFSNDIKVRLGKDYVYPDVLVDCTNTEDDSYFANAPILIVEVLSQTTRKRDLTVKLVKYINLASLQEYVVVEQDSAAVTVFCRQHDWQPEYYVLGDLINFSSIGLTLAVAEIYERVNNSDMREYRENLGLGNTV